jgi:hypothetical protein
MNDLVGKNSYSSMYLRYADSEDVSTQSVYLSTRLSVGPRFFIMPRLRADYQDFAADQTRWRVAPSLRFDWRRSPALGFELESGYEWSSREGTVQTIDMDGYYLRIGYRSLF